MRLSRRLLFCLLILLLLFQAPLLTAAAPPIVYQYASKSGRAQVALTFDDGPHPRYTGEILDILKEFGVVATFFVVGENAQFYPELVRRAVEEGHEIGNHSENHYHVANMSQEALSADIDSCNRALEEITGQRPTLFRPPEGVCNDFVREICQRNQMTIVMWSVDTRDWAHTPVVEIYKNVQKNVKNGSIVLMHDFIGQKSPTPAALRRIIPMLRELGYEFVTVSQLLEGGE